MGLQSRESSRAIISGLPRFGPYVHDGEHSFDFVREELSLASAKLTSPGIMVDDIDWSNGFFAHCVERRLRPLLLTDNGKDNLRVRIGLAKLDYHDNNVAEIAGA